MSRGETGRSPIPRSAQKPKIASRPKPPGRKPVASTARLPADWLLRLVGSHRTFLPKGRPGVAGNRLWRWRALGLAGEGASGDRPSWLRAVRQRPGAPAFPAPSPPNSRVTRPRPSTDGTRSPTNRISQRELPSWRSSTAQPRTGAHSGHGPPKEPARGRLRKHGNPVVTGALK